MTFASVDRRRVRAATVFAQRSGVLVRGPDGQEGERVHGPG